jgi:hypothetical protein
MLLINWATVGKSNSCKFLVYGVKSNLKKIYTFYATTTTIIITNISFKKMFKEEVSIKVILHTHVTKLY